MKNTSHILFACLSVMSAPTLADTVISAFSPPPPYHIHHNSDSKGYIYEENIYFVFKDAPDNMAPRDVDSEACLSVSGTMSVYDDTRGYLEKTNIDGWGTLAFTGSTPTYAFLGFDVTLKNKCDHKVAGWVGMFGTNLVAAINSAYVEVPPAAACGITIHDPVFLGNLFPGDNIGHRISVASGGYGHGRLTLSPTMKQNNQGLLTSPGGGTLSYVLDSDGEATWDHGTLVGALDQNFVAFASTVPSHTLGGNYTGTLVAEVACE